MKERIIRILNIKLSESSYVFDLLRIQFFIGIANAFINIVAFTYFVYDFSISGLPYAYLGMGAGLLILNRFYQKLEHKLSPLHLLQFLIVSSAGVIFLFWTGLIAFDKHILIFLLLIWSSLFYMVTGYAYWGLVSLVFNVRESRRVFSIVGSGDIPTKLIGYLSAPLLIPVLGLQNLLILSVVSLLIGHLLITKLIGKKSWTAFRNKGHSHHHVDKSNKKRWQSLFFKNKLIFTISLLSILSYNVFNFIDYTFVAQVKLRYHDLAQLASFIATFFALGRLLALFLKLVFTSRLIERLGIIACLLITPAALFIFSLIFLSFNLNFEYSIYIFGMMALLTEVLRSTMQEPVFFILFQPLNEHQRLEGHIIAKGYMLPPSLFIVGASLILMRYLNIDLTISTTIKILVANLIVWAAIIIFIKKEYIKTLHRSIARGIFNGESIQIYDQKTIEILLAKAYNGNDSEIVYALKLLESAGYDQLDEVLEEQLFSGTRDVKKFALGQLEKRGRISSDILKKSLELENDAEVKELLIGALCRLDASYLHNMFDELDSQDFAVKKSIIIQLLNGTEFTYLFKAGREIDHLIRSTDPRERELAINIISELDKIKFNDVISELMQDREPAVRRSAIIAACKLRTASLLPFLLELMTDSSDRLLVIQGLLQYGDSLFLDLKHVPQELVNRNEEDLIKVAGRTKGQYSTSFLFESMESSILLHDKIVNALWAKGIEVQNVASIHRFQQLANSYLARGIEKINYYASVPSFNDQHLVKNALASEIRNDLITSLKICALLYHKKEINRVLELIDSGIRKKLFNAMEMLELVLPKKTAKQLNYLFDHILDPEATRRTIIKLSPVQFFRNIVHSKEDFFNSWTKSVCIYCSLKNKETDFIQSLHQLSDESAIVRETKQFVLETYQLPAYAHY